jgi:hypothetical protein
MTAKTPSRPKGRITLNEVAGTLWGHMERCEDRAQAAAHEATATRVEIGKVESAVEKVVERLDDLNMTAWRSLGAIGLTVLGAVAIVLLQNWFLHAQTNGSVTEASVVTTAQSQITTETLAKNQQTILQKLNALQAPPPHTTHPNK